LTIITQATSHIKFDEKLGDETLTKILQLSNIIIPPIHPLLFFFLFAVGSFFEEKRKDMKKKLIGYNILANLSIPT